jgi:hypothetical protein
MARTTQSAEPPAPPAPGTWIIRKRHRDWMVIDPAGQLVCLTVYRRGAEEVVRRLAAEARLEFDTNRHTPVRKLLYTNETMLAF